MIGATHSGAPSPHRHCLPPSVDIAGLHKKRRPGGVLYFISPRVICSIGPLDGLSRIGVSIPTGLTLISMSWPSAFTVSPS